MDTFGRIQVASLTIGSKTFSIFNGVNTIGRNRTAVVNIKHLNVSQNQALILIVNDNQHYISDMNSSNGTFVLDSKLVPFKLYELTHNDKIMFGDIIAKYTKISTANTMVNSQQTLNNSDMTQNMTQNFYASNTQLIVTDTDTRDHNYSSSPRPDKTLSNIHEEATQVIEYPKSLSLTHNQNSERDAVIEDAPKRDIHFAATQVCDFSKPTSPMTIQSDLDESKEIEDKSSTSSTQIFSENERQEITSRISTINKQITEIAILTQNSNDTNMDDENIVPKGCLKNQSSDVPQNEELNSIGNLEMKVVHESQEPGTSGLRGLTTTFNESCSNSLDISRPEDFFIDETVTENSNSNNSIDFLVANGTLDGNILKETIKAIDSQTNLECDIRKIRKPISKLPSTQLDDEDTETSQEIFKTVPKPVPKLPNTPLESDTDNTQEIGFRRKHLKPIIDNSDSETDLDESQPEMSTKLEENANSSGSETDCEDAIIDRSLPKLKLPSVSNKTTEDVSDSDNDVESNKQECELNDTDCIPATQDAFAEAFGYKSTKSSQMSNSEESFKLGLTELMEFPDNDNTENSQNNVEITEKNAQNEIVNNVKTSDVEDKSEIKIVNTGAPKKFKFKNKSSNLNNSLSTVLSINKNTERQQSDINEDMFSQPTQKIDDNFFLPTQSINTTDIPSVSLGRSSQFSKPEIIDFKSKSQSHLNNKDSDKINEDEIETDHIEAFAQSSSTKKSSKVDNNDSDKNNDVFLQPTQNINDFFVRPIQSTNTADADIPSASSDKSGHSLKPEIRKSQSQLDNKDSDKTNEGQTETDDTEAAKQISSTKKSSNNNNSDTEDDVFLQPTQNIDDAFFLRPTQSTNTADIPSTLSYKDDVFLKPQMLNFKSKSQSQNIIHQDDDIYLASTQIIQEIPTVNENTASDMPLTQEDIYEQSTQKIDCIRTTVSDGNQKDQDVYMLATQQITDDSNTDPTDTQLELQSYNENFELELCVGFKRPENPMAVELNNEATKELEIASSKQKEKEENRAENQESSSKTSRSANDNSETLSQIAAFIKNPLLPSEPTKEVQLSKTLNVTETSETLSQIETFIKNPIEAPVSNNTKRKTLKRHQIQASVDKPRPENNSLSEKNLTLSVPSIPRRTSTRRSSNTSGTISEDKTKKRFEAIAEEKVVKELSSSNLKEDEDDSEKDTSREIRSDIDQSFALLESKNSKTRKKQSTDPVLEEIKVSVTAHRRSMSTAENKNQQLVVPVRKSKRASSANTSSAVDTELPALKWRNSRLRSSGVEIQIKDEDVKIIDEESDHTYANLSHGVSSKTVKTRISKLDLINENVPLETKVDKLSENPKVKENKRKSRIPSNNNEDDINHENILRTRKAKILIGNIKTLPKDEKLVRSSDYFETDINTKVGKIGTNKRITAISESKRIITTSEDYFEETPVPNRAVKRHVNSSNEVVAGPSTPAKHARIGSTKMDDSNEVVAGPSTPAKHVRISKTKINDSNDVSTMPKRGRKGKSKIDEDTCDKSIDNDTFTTPKKNRLAPKMETLTTSAERVKRKLRPKVVFTMLDSPQLESFIRHLGGSIVDSIECATVLVTQSVKRSQKLLTAVATGKPICAPNWIQESKNKNEFLDPWDYILIDKDAESKWNFSLKESLKKAEEKKLFAGYLFQLMVNNAVDVLKGAIDASGGKCVTKLPSKNQLENFVIVASPEHKAKYGRMKKQHPGITVVEPEAIFDGVLRQEIRFSKHILT